MKHVTLLLVAFTSLATAELASSQTYHLSRAPVAAGTVVDRSPFNPAGAGDQLEPGLAIGSAGDEIRKAVLEFDIRDLAPGLVHSAKLTGQISPIELTPSGTRSSTFTLLAGNGQIDLDDNIQSGSQNVRGVIHQAGQTTSYDRDITRQFRHIMSDAPQYFKQLVRPSNSSQGLDKVVSASLEVELRPSTPETRVYYQEPTTSAVARAESGGPFTINTAAEGVNVVNAPYAPFVQERGIMEFDLSSIPTNATIQWATLDVSVGGYQISGDNRVPNLEIVGYQADGQVTAADVGNPGTWSRMTGPFGQTGTPSWAVDTELVQSITRAGGHLGLRLQPGDNPDLHVSIGITSSAGSAFAPRLAIAYVVPEPATLSLLIPLLAVLFLHHAFMARR